jgi:hypothetical protein
VAGSSSPIASQSSVAATAASVAVASVPVEAVLDELAVQARSLALSTAANAQGSTAAPVRDTAVKEIELALQPDELGSVNVTIRLSGGALSIVIEAVNASAVKELDSKKQAIADRLTSDGQAVASVLVRQATAPNGGAILSAGVSGGQDSSVGGGGLGAGQGGSLQHGSGRGADQGGRGDSSAHSTVATSSGRDRLGGDRGSGLFV